MATGNSLFVGIGSGYGDDQVGWRVADAVAGRVGAGLRVDRMRSPSELLDSFAGIERLHICDACHGAGAAGAWHRWRWPDARIEPVHFSGSHDLGLAAVLTLGERLGQLPTEIVIWGIEVSPAVEPEAFLRSHLAPDVERAATEVAERVVQELKGEHS